MSLIVCTDPCIYQKEGYCSLSRAASTGQRNPGGCVNFVPRSLQQSGQGFPDIGNTNQLQALRRDQFPLDPLGDQTL